MHLSVEKVVLTGWKGGGGRSEAHLAPGCPWAAASHPSFCLIGIISHSSQTAFVQRSEKIQPQAAAIPNYSQTCFFCSLPQKGGCRTITAFPAPHVLQECLPPVEAFSFTSVPTSLLWRHAWSMRSNVSKTSNSLLNSLMLLFILLLYHYLLF